MNIFNSLGSNYSWKFISKSLFTVGSGNSRAKLREQLSEHFKGSVSLTYKGREALEMALIKSNLPKGSSIGINGFTCYVVYEAVFRAGYKPVFIDLEPNTMHYGLKQLEEIDSRNKLSAIIIQNTLGYPADIIKLQDYSQKHSIMIIEDLAHSFGAVYENGKEAGTVGAFSMLSFSQDKTMDVVAGGACINLQNPIEQSKDKLFRISKIQLLINRAYPFWTGLIRGLYPLGLGKYLHFGLKKLHLLASPMADAGKGIHNISKASSKLALNRWLERQVELEHRIEIAHIYESGINSELKLGSDTKGFPSYLRFPLITEKREELIKYLKRSGVHIGDTWYDAPIGPKKYLEKTNYTLGQCPEAEKLSANIVNLPTHRYVTPDIAKAICAKIKQWQQSNQNS